MSDIKRPLISNASPEEIRDEQIRMTRLRVLVDVTAQLLVQVPLSRQETLQVIDYVRDRVVELCPGKEDVFDLVLRPRFLRILNERAIKEWGLTDSLN